MTAQTLANQAEANTQSERSSVPGQSSHEEANLEKVRELLFGNQLRSSDQQFKALETELAALKTEFEGRLEHLEDIVHKGFDSITQQIQAEREERKTAIATTEASIQSLGENVQQKQAQLDQKIDSKTQAVLQKILDHSSQFTEALHQKSQELLRDINEESKRRQQQERAHNSRLSALFGELSERLHDE